MTIIKYPIEFEPSFGYFCASWFAAKKARLEEATGSCHRTTSEVTLPFMVALPPNGPIRPLAKSSLRHRFCLLRERRYAFMILKQRIYFQMSPNPIMRTERTQMIIGISRACHCPQRMDSARLRHTSTSSIYPHAMVGLAMLRASRPALLLSGATAVVV